jgi:hypothetical protein
MYNQNPFEDAHERIAVVKVNSHRHSAKSPGTEVLAAKSSVGRWLEHCTTASCTLSLDAIIRLLMALFDVKITW